MAKSSTSVYNALELMNGLPFKRTVSGMEIDGSNNKEDSSSPEKMAEGRNLGDEPEWMSVRVWLQLIQTFLTFVPSWSNTNVVVRDHLGDLVISIENEFQTSADEIAESIKKGDAEVLDAVRRKLLNNIVILKPRIREAYDFFSKHALRKSSTQLPITDSEVWGQFCSSLTVASHFLSTPMLLQIEGIVSSLQAFFEVYLTRASDCKLFRKLGLYFECVAIRLARLLFLWWADETDEHDMTVMLKDAFQAMPQHRSGVRNGKLTVPSTSQGLNITGSTQVQPGIQSVAVNSYGAANMSLSQQTLKQPESGENSEHLADMAKKPRNLKRPKISSLDSPSLSFNPSTDGQIIENFPPDEHSSNVQSFSSSKNDTWKKQKEENDALKKKIQELEESLRREKSASETKGKELDIVRSEKTSLETEIERFRAFSLM